MANRFPLIANSSANQIQELASGDNLDLTGSNISNAGIITATSGFSIGISSAGTSVAGGPVKTFNFVGAGNTFAYNSGQTLSTSALLEAVVEPLVGVKTKFSMRMM